MNDDGSFNPENFYRALTPRTKLVGVAGISNVLGTVFPVKEIAAAAHANGALCLVDACQSVVHQKIDVKDIGCDFLAFPATKLTVRPASGFCTAVTNCWLPCRLTRPAATWLKA